MIHFTNYNDLRISVRLLDEILGTVFEQGPSLVAQNPLENCYESND